ncbi:MAG: shikimate dehydrogenase [Lachnospiraceae bacterium]|nr:shikimate dehydrogenase [Lachnospiraceae bacterium]
MNIMKYAIEGYKDIQSDKYIGIFGNPIKHTLSPVIHDTISKELGISERYIPFHITDNLGEAISTAFSDGVLGLNITVPYKQEVMQYLVDVDPAAKAIGAVNTLVRMEEGYKGYNTDMPGLYKAITSEGLDLAGSKVIMFGAGGAARAVAYMCVNYGASKVYIVNRTYENAKKIAEDMNKAFDKDVIVPVSSDSYKDIPVDSYLFIQCTSVGLHEKDGLPLVDDKEFFNMAIAGVDLIYNPAKTPFLKLMEDLGKKAINGLKMLLYQGVMAYELWNELTVSDELVEKVYIALRKAIYGDNIVLIGFMGSGKTTVGRYIESHYGYSFLDTDAYIEEKEGMSISDIFATKGEEYFRKLETEVLEELSLNLSNTVVSTGGGMPLKEGNARFLKKIGKVFYLKASSSSIYERVKDDTGRPLLQVKDPYAKVCEMLEIRNPIYETASDFILDTDRREVETIASTITSNI